MMIDNIIHRVNAKAKKLDDDLLKTVREQASESSKGTQNLETAKQAITVCKLSTFTKKYSGIGQQDERH